MYPYLFDNENIPTFFIMMAIGIIAAVLLFKHLCLRFKVDDKSYNFYSSLGLISIAVGLISAVLFQQLYNLIDFWSGNTDTFKWEGITFFGGLIGGAATFIIITALHKDVKVKNNFWNVANLAAPCIVIGHAFGRFGCFLAGCCYGLPSEHGLKFLSTANLRAYAHTGGKAIPTNLYEALFLTALLAALFILLLVYKKRNLLLLVYGYAYAVFRFVIEYFRGDDRGSFIPGLTPSQFQSILLLAAVVFLTVLIYKYKRLPFYKEPPSAGAPDSEENTSPEEKKEEN